MMFGSIDFFSTIDVGLCNYILSFTDQSINLSKMKMVNKHLYAKVNLPDNVTLIANTISYYIGKNHIIVKKIPRNDICNLVIKIAQKLHLKTYQHFFDKYNISDFNASCFFDYAGSSIKIGDEIAASAIGRDGTNSTIAFTKIALGISWLKQPKLEVLELKYL